MQELPTRYPPTRRVLMFLAVLLIVSVSLKVLAAAPVWIHYDENYYLNISQNYIERGELTPYMWRLDEGTNIIAGSGSGYGILFLTNWMKLVGPTLVNGRLLMVINGVLTAGVMYFVASKWWGSRAAGVVALVFALVSTSPFYSFVIRMDSFGMLAYSLLLLLHIHAVRGHRLWVHAAVGPAAVVAAEFHILGIIYLAALTLYYLIEYVREAILRRRIVLNTAPVYFALGGFVAGLIYIAVHILPNPQAYFAISGQCWQCGDLSLDQELLRFSRFIVMRSIEFGLLVIAIGSAAYRRRPEDRHYLMICSGWLLVQSLIGIPPFTHYTYHIWPLIAIGTAGFITRGLRSAGQLSTGRFLAGLALAIALLLFNFGLHIMNFQPFELRFDTEAKAQAEFVQEIVPQDTVVMADVSLFYPLQRFTNFLSYRNGDMYGTGLRGESQLDFWRRVQPLVIIGDYRDEDPELDQYMTELGFEQIVPEVWIAAPLLQEIGLKGS
jgi:hypothetical protein